MSSATFSRVLHICRLHFTFIKIYTMLFYFLDVVEESWTQRHSRDIIILVIAALVALAAIIGFIVWKKRKNKNKQV